MFNKKKLPITVKSVVSPNLVPQEEKEEQAYDAIAQTIKKLAQLAIILLLVLWGIGGLLILRINQEKKSFTQLETETNREKLQELTKINSQLKDLHVLNSKVDKSVKSEYLFSGLLDEFTKIVPSGVAVTAFETVIEQPGWLRIKGVARNRSDFLKLKEGLESSQYYEKVDSPLSNYVTPESLSFELNVLVKDWKPVWADEIKKKSKRKTTTEESLE